MGNAQFQAKRSKAFHPRCGGSRTGATSSSFSAGAAWGDRYCPLLYSYQHLEFHINGKGILQSLNSVKTIHGKIRKMMSVSLKKVDLKENRKT